MQLEHLEDIQQFIVGQLEELSAIELGGARVIAEDGTYPKTPGREQGLATEGLVLIVWRVESIGSGDDLQTPDGWMAYNIGIVVLIEENQQVCRGPTGVNVPYEKALRLVMEWLPGRGIGGCGGQNPFRNHTQPFDNLGKESGINRAIASFTKLLINEPFVLQP